MSWNRSQKEKRTEKVTKAVSETGQGPVINYKGEQFQNMPGI